MVRLSRWSLLAGTGLFGLVLAAPVMTEAQAPSSPAHGQQARPTGPLGVWIDHTNRGAVEITPCAPNGAAARNLCGRIVWLKQPNDEKGRPLRDVLNKDPKKRGGPICGLQVIGDVKPQAPGQWDGGWIYDPEKGSSFDLEITLLNPDVLQIKGYLGIKWLNETYRWRRADPAWPRCPGLT